MYQDRILLTAADILKKDFKIDTRGYRPQEVDKFLDMIIHDYEETNKYIAEKEEEMKALVEDNIKLKQEIRSLNEQLEISKNILKTILRMPICLDASQILKKLFTVMNNILTNAVFL